MKNLERRLSQIETQARDSMVYAKFRDQRGDVKMDFMRAAKLFLHGEIGAIHALDFDPPHDPLKDLTFEELRALLTIVEETGGDLKNV